MQRIWIALTPTIFLGLWSGGYVVAKVALLDATPMALLALRFAAVIAIMAVLFIILRPATQDYKRLAAFGLCWVFDANSLFWYAYFAFINGVAVSTAAMIFSMQPILVVLLAPSWSGETVN